MTYDMCVVQPQQLAQHVHLLVLACNERAQKGDGTIKDTCKPVLLTSCKQHRGGKA